ncbi:hypothetical protein BGZ99_006557 [Dissophora globulifera]|uniref:Uncharacterized protein n=1 Tax=Dissophora globulifera TaxID=979702 RepID=A0A9P6RD66_9FUNG|nr:hypothetical protein BGZ99_006557 [Dissophora globulifera]
MSSYSAYSSHHRQGRPPVGAASDSADNSRSPSPTGSPSPSKLSAIYPSEYNYNNNAAAAPTPNDTAYAPSPAGSPTSTLYSAHPAARGSSNTLTKISDTLLASLTRWKRMRLAVMRMATVERLQLLWALLALFGTMSWIALMPAYAFRNKFDAVHFKAPCYTFFLIATVSTSLSAIWQSLCPFLVRQSQRALLPRIINHPATQTTTICVSVILTIFNFFSWIILASNKEYGAQKSCIVGPLSTQPGYAAQCRGVNVAIVLDVVVFLLWIPISVVIVCGTIERGLWWWGEDDGWAQGETNIGGSNMMSEEEFDMKIGLGGSKQIKRRQTVHPETLEQQDRVMIQQPKPAFVTPIASQFRSNSSLGFGDDNTQDDDEDFTNLTPSSYRRHHQQRQQPKPQLTRRGSNTSLSSRLSTFFGNGWNSGQMAEAEQPPMPPMPAHYRQETAAGSRPSNINHSGSSLKREQQQQPRKKTEPEQKAEEQEQEEDTVQHGDAYTSQWHSRRYDDWS